MFTSSPRFSGLDSSFKHLILISIYFFRSLHFANFASIRHFAVRFIFVSNRLEFMPKERNVCSEYATADERLYRNMLERKRISWEKISLEKITENLVSEGVSECYWFWAAIRRTICWLLSDCSMNQRSQTLKVRSTDSTFDWNLQKGSSLSSSAAWMQPIKQTKTKFPHLPHLIKTPKLWKVFSKPLWSISGVLWPIACY